jgi:hypothetical protein
MVTVTGLCNLIADQADMPLQTVQRFARTLINSGDLPKASGRAIPVVDMAGRAKMLLALAAADSPNNCLPLLRTLWGASDRLWQKEESAGEFMAAEMEALAAYDFATWRRWQEGWLEVSRDGLRVLFALGRSLPPSRRPSNDPDYLAREEWMARVAEQRSDTWRIGVFAKIHGRLAIAVACGMPYEQALQAAVAAQPEEEEIG